MIILVVDEFLSDMSAHADRQVVPRLAQDSGSSSSKADKKRPAAPDLKVMTSVAHLDLGQVDRGLVNLRGRGEAGLEIAGQRLASKV